MQRVTGRWLWRCKLNVKNELVHKETGWSSFKERKVKANIKCLVRMAFSDGVVAEIGRACLLVGLKSKWWRRVKYLCEKTELF